MTRRVSAGVPPRAALLIGDPPSPGPSAAALRCLIEALHEILRQPQTENLEVCDRQDPHGNPVQILTLTTNQIVAGINVTEPARPERMPVLDGTQASAEHAPDAAVQPAHRRRPAKPAEWAEAAAGGVDDRTLSEDLFALADEEHGKLLDIESDRASVPAMGSTSPPSPVGRRPRLRPPVGVWQAPLSPGQDPGAAPRWWFVGAHGGAGASSLTAALPAGGDAGRCWPSEQERSGAVVVVARTHATGLAGARALAGQAARGQTPKHAWLAGLVTVADAPGRLPASLRRLRDMTAAAYPRAWHVPWIGEWREQPPDPQQALPPDVHTLGLDLAELTEPEGDHP